MGECEILARPTIGAGSARGLVEQGDRIARLSGKRHREPDIRRVCNRAKLIEGRECIGAAAHGDAHEDQLHCHRRLTREQR